MKIDLEYLRQHFADLSDDALREIDRSELVEAARGCYDEEVARRRLTVEPDAGAEPPDGPEVEEAEADLDAGDGTTPAWLEGAACACTFVEVAARPRSQSAQFDAAEACDVLEAAGIPCHVALEKIEEEGTERRRDEYRVLVPGGRNLEAMSILDRDLFNVRLEAEWRAHLAELSDSDLRALSPELICAGFLDRAERLKRVYEDEAARRSAGAR